MKQRYFGFYWTYPIPSVGFASLPDDVTEAAKCSVTIRYSRAVVRAHVARNGGVLDPGGEIVRMEIDPDRGSQWLAGEFTKLLNRAREESAYVAIVVFSDHKKWRGHMYLDKLYDDEACDPIRLSHDDLPSDEDPYEHFAKRKRERYEQFDQRKAAKPLHRDNILTTLRSMSEPGSLVQQAETLNEEGLRTWFGKPWTATNLRKFLALDRPAKSYALTNLP